MTLEEAQYYMSADDWKAMQSCVAGACDQATYFTFRHTCGETTYYTVYTRNGFIVRAVEYDEAFPILVEHVRGQILGIPLEDAETVADEILTTENEGEGAALAKQLAEKAELQKITDESTLAAISATQRGATIIPSYDPKIFDDVEELQDKTLKLETKTDLIASDVQHTNDRLRALSDSVPKIADRAASEAVKPLVDDIESTNRRIDDVRQLTDQSAVNKRVNELAASVPVVARDIAESVVAPVEVKVSQIQSDIDELEAVDAKLTEELQTLGAIANDHATHIDKLSGYQSPEQLQQQAHDFRERHIQLYMKAGRTREEAIARYERIANVRTRAETSR